MTLCLCGCGQEIIQKSIYRISKYLQGHASRIYPIPESYQKWLDDKKPKIICACGCNQEIIINESHKWNGIPKFIKGHHKGNLGKHHTEESNQKNRDAHLGKNKGNLNPFFGKHHTEEIKEKLRILNEGKKQSPESIEKRIKLNTGKKRTEETKDKMRGDKNPAKRPEVREKLSGKNSSNWKGGISFEPYCPKFNNKLREEIRNQYDRKCYLCGKDEKDNITKNGVIWRLSVHHIDNDKEQGCNGKPWKLIPLCMHCHNSKKWIF